MSASQPTLGSLPSKRILSARRRRLFIAIVILALALAQEALCRWMFPLPQCANFNRINYTPVQFYSDDLWEARQRGLANVKLRMESEPDGFAFDHTLNLYGFRGPNFSLDPPAERTRILFIGDSFTEGAGAADEETIPEQFTRLLQGRKAVEAINLGVSGTGLADYALMTRDSVPLLRPKAVFLVVCFNDIPAGDIAESEALAKPPASFPRLSPWAPRALAALARWWAGDVVPGRFPSGPISFLSPVPSLANPLSRTDPPANFDPEILSAMQRGRTNPWNMFQATMHERALSWDFAKNGGGAGAYLKHIASTCAQHECRLIVVYIPHQVTTNPRYMEAQVKMGAQYGKLTRLDDPEHRACQRHLQEVTAALGIPFLDATEELIEAEKNGAAMFWPVDGHCTAAGYRLLAEMCERFWLDGTLPRGTGPADASKR